MVQNPSIQGNVPKSYFPASWRRHRSVNSPKSGCWKEMFTLLDFRLENQWPYLQLPCVRIAPSHLFSISREGGVRARGRGAKGRCILLHVGVEMHTSLCLNFHSASMISKFMDLLQGTQIAMSQPLAAGRSAATRLDLHRPNVPGFEFHAVPLSFYPTPPQTKIEIERF